MIALTSISEALPLVVLEGFAAGVPSITTNVGACRQMIDQYRVLYQRLMAAPSRAKGAEAARGGCPMHAGRAAQQAAQADEVR